MLAVRCGNTLSLHVRGFNAKTTCKQGSNVTKIPSIREYSLAARLSHSLHPLSWEGGLGREQCYVHVSEGC